MHVIKIQVNKSIGLHSLLKGQELGLRQKKQKKNLIGTSPLNAGKLFSPVSSIYAEIS